MKQKEEKTIEALAHEKQCNELASRIMRLDRFLGGLQDYVTFKKAQHSLLEGDVIEILDTGRPEKYTDINIYYGSSLNNPRGLKEIYEKLFEDGLIGFISIDRYLGLGTPVGIKRKNHPFR